MRKISLVRLLFKPVSTIRHIWEVCRRVEIDFKVKIDDKKEKAPLPPDGYVTLDSYHVVLSVAEYNRIKDGLFRLDYSYINNQKVWCIKDAEITTTAFTKDEMTALHVAKRLGV